jgi:hypothetical protein
MVVRVTWRALPALSHSGLRERGAALSVARSGPQWGAGRFKNARDVVYSIRF